MAAGDWWPQIRLPQGVPPPANLDPTFDKVGFQMQLGGVSLRVFDE